MKLFRPLSLGILLTTAIVACKKDADPPVDLGGTTWVDSANVNSVPYKPFTIVLNANGTASVTFQGLSPFAGSWNKPATKDSVYFFFDESSTTKWKGQGKLTDGNKKIEGTLTRTAPSALSGTFRVTRQ